MDVHEFRPRVSIIIAVLNGAATLTRCLDSIIAQDYPNKEIVVLDGGSTDGTVDILRAYDAHIGYWVSEPDTGIYDAWNKGLAQASGRWVCFVGSDDWYPDSNSLSSLMNMAAAGAYDYVSGRGAIVNPREPEPVVFGLPWDWRRESRRMHVCHPASLYHRNLFERLGGFLEQYRIAADYDFNLRMGSTIRAGYLDRIVIHLGDEGLSHRQILSTIKETVAIQARNPEIGVMAATGNAGMFLIEFTAYKALTALGLYRAVRRLLLSLKVLER